MASNLEERAVRQWLATPAGVGGVGGVGEARQPAEKQAGGFGALLSKLTRCLTRIFRGRKKKQEWVASGGHMYQQIRARTHKHTRTHKKKIMWRTALLIYTFLFSLC